MTYKLEIIRQLNALNNGNVFGQLGETICKIDKTLCLAWDNWDEDIVRIFYEFDKPKYPTEDFITAWVENEDFEASGYNLNELINEFAK